MDDTKEQKEALAGQEIEAAQTVNPSPEQPPSSDDVICACGRVVEKNSPQPDQCIECVDRR
jgi:hypothetical protein